ncbi:MAG: CPBP family intramembrane glutamic endopeptidase [Bacteroidota bacterium]
MFLKRAKEGENDLWRYVITIFVLIFAATLGGLPLVAVMTINGAKAGKDPVDLQKMLAEGNYEALEMSSNTFLFFLLLQFVFVFFALWLMVRTLHKKSFTAITTARSKVDWSRVWFGFGLWAAFLASAETVSYFLDPENYIWQLDLKAFLPLLAIALLILPIQTSAEELVTRGYLMQGISLIVEYRWIPLLVTSLLFGLLHISNPEVAKYGFWVTMPGYIGIGVALAIMTLMDDGLELALGVHAANNIFGALFVTFEGSVLSTPALFKVLEINPLIGTIFTLIFSAVFIVISARKYGWKDWTKVYGKIERAQREVEKAEWQA